MQIKIDIDVNNYNGGPKIKIFLSDELYFDKTLAKPGPQTIKIDYDKDKLKNFVLEHYGKDMDNDTLVSGDKIVSDKGFTIHKISFDQITLQNEIYDLDFITQQGTVVKNNNYVGYNGKYVIDFNDKNLVTWHLGLQKSFINKQKSYNFEEFKNEIFQNKTYQVEY
jgi:hypothetical protein